MSKYGLRLASEIAHGRASILIFGEPKVGKTSLVRTIPCPPERILYVCADPGTLAIRDLPIPVLDLTKFTKPEADAPMTPMGAVHYLYNHIGEICREEGFEWVVIDGLNKMGEICLEAFQENEKNNPSGKGGKPDLFKVWGEVATYMKSMILKLRDLPSISTLFLTHEDYDDQRGIYQPDFPGKAVTKQLLGMFDEIGHYRHDFDDEGNAKRVIQFDKEYASGYAVGDRSGALKGLTEPSIKAIFEKIHGTQENN